MNPKSLFYEESKEINQQRMLLGGLVCLLVSILTGYFYALIVTFIPLIYFVIFANIGVGILLSFCIRIVAKVTHNRNKKSQLILALVTGLLVNYFQWVTYLMYVSTGQIPSITAYLQNLGLLFSMNNFFGAIAEINETGLWSLFGIQFKGLVLASVWMAEFLLILLIPIVSIQKAKVFPYSEKLKKWYPKYTLDENFKSIGGGSSLIKLLQKDVIGTITQLGLGNADRYTKIHLFYVEEEQAQYIDFEKITIDRKGNTTKDILIENFTIDNATAKELLTIFDHKREQFEII